MRYLPTFLLLFLFLVACAPSSLFATPTATFTPTASPTSPAKPATFRSKRRAMGPLGLSTLSSTAKKWTQKMS